EDPDQDQRQLSQTIHGHSVSSGISGMRPDHTTSQVTKVRLKPPSLRRAVGPRIFVTSVVDDPPKTIDGCTVARAAIGFPPRARDGPVARRRRGRPASYDPLRPL